jgi:hypothetical protein
MSALPRYFRRQLVPLWRGHHRPQCRGTGQCFRSSCARVTAARLADYQYVGRSGLPWSVAVSGCRKGVGLSLCMQCTRRRGAAFRVVRPALSYRSAIVRDSAVRLLASLQTWLRARHTPGKRGDISFDLVKVPREGVFSKFIRSRKTTSNRSPRGHSIRKVTTLLHLREAYKPSRHNCLTSEPPRYQGLS